MSLRARPRSIVLASSALAVATVLTTLAATADAGSRPPLTLVASTQDVIEVTRYDDYIDLYNGLGIYVTSGDQPVEIRAGRTDYSSPVVGTMQIGTGANARRTTLPAGVVGFDGLKDFTRIRLVDASGKTRFDYTPGFCGGDGYSDPIRLTPDAPDTPPYPYGCAAHPFTLGTFIGLAPSRGFPVTVDQYGYYGGSGSQTVPDMSETALPDGDYKVLVTIGSAWRKILGTSAAQSTASTRIRITTLHDDEDGGGSAGAAAAPEGIRSLAEGPGPVVGGLQLPNGRGPVTAAQGGPLGVRIPRVYAGKIDGTLPKREESATVMGRTASGKPLALPSHSEALSSQGGTAARSVPQQYRPDLRTLPAFGFTVITGEESEQYAQPGYGAEPGHEYLAFSATVWNAGPGPMVVDGFRQPNATIMQAYQSFYDDKGRRKTYAPTGSMQYDPRPGHQHWHFLDFAKYQLRKPDGSTVRSQKEAFCLAPTDAVDMRLKGADWHPYSTGLSSACGYVSALGIRETLPAAWGDTYGQYLPGQAFDITDLPNGTYQVEVVANPEHHLIETSTGNNTSTRTIVLGGKPGARTVTAPKVGLVDAP